MNYLILDTEKTYNYGYILVNHNQEVLLRRNLIIQNNFENRNIIGENTYKTKKRFYEADPDARFISSAEGANIIANDLSTNNIDFIIAHNANEDKRQLELLHQQTGVSFSQIPFYDSINLVKILFPNNTQTGLEAIVSDITNGSIQQTHTALQDCDLLLSFILPILPYLGYFIEYKEIFAHDNDYEITYKVLSNLKQILPLPKSIKEIQNILSIDSRGDKTKLTNFFKKTSQSYDFWTTDGSVIDKSKNFQIVVALANLTTSLEEIRGCIVQSCSKYNNNTNSVDFKHFSEELENKRFSEELENYRRLVREYEKRLQYYEEYVHQKSCEYKQQISNYENENHRLKEENQTLRTARRRPRMDSSIIESALIEKMTLRFQTLSRGGIFNREARRFKKAWKKKNIEVVFELLNN